MIPDPELMVTLARRIEVQAGKKGWDNMGVGLGLVFARPDGAYSRPFPLQPDEIDDRDPIAGLFWIGATLRIRNAPPVMPPEYAAHFAGLMFASEAWFNDDPALERDTDQRALADIPGSLECRFVHIVDCGGRYHVVTRIRGKKPETITVQPGDPDAVVVGRIPVALRAIMLGIAKRLPFGSMDLDAVTSLPDA